MGGGHVQLDLATKRIRQSEMFPCKPAKMVNKLSGANDVRLFLKSGSRLSRAKPTCHIIIQARCRASSLSHTKLPPFSLICSDRRDVAA